tara:strand:+ start:264 stop:425 length:162 start_codon:yes stop_codon:yes gene_type:complete
LDPTLDYYEKENGILAIPNYLGILMVSDEKDTVDYLSAEEEPNGSYTTSIVFK